ncbi:AsmA-like C-terminal domain-containing protein [Thermodesulfobacteriota bacterium]
MKSKRKIFMWIAAGAATIFALLLILILIVPHVVDMTPYKEKALAEISRTIKGQANFQDARLRFFPRPHLEIDHGMVSIPGKADVVVDALAIFPKILPLFGGDVRVYRLQVEGPTLTLSLPDSIGQSNEKRSDTDVAIGEMLRSGLSHISAIVPGLVLVVKNGNLSFTRGKAPGFWFKDIHALIKCPPDRLEMDLKCESSFWKHISLKGSVDPEKLDSFGQLELVNFQPRGLANYFFPSVLQYLGDSELNLNLNFKTEGSGILQADVQGSIPRLTLYPESKKQVIRSKRFKGTVSFTEEKQSIILTELNLDHPRINLSGQFQMDRTVPQVNLDLVGRDIDVKPARSMTTALLGGNSVVETIFNIVKGGNVPLIRFHSSGKSMGDLGSLKNMVIEGSLNEGNIFVPKAELDLKEVNGEVTISNGILVGRKLNAKLGNSSGQDGTLKLGLFKENPLFHLDLALDADPAQVVPILERFVRNARVLEFSSLIDDLRGNAKGRVILGERLDFIRVNVDVSEFNLSARYRPLMFPFEVRGGEYSYKGGRQIVIKNLAGSLGASTISGLYAGFDLRDSPQLDIKSGVSTLDLKEIYALLSSFEAMKDKLKDVDAPSGSIKLSSMEVKGPLFDPAQWQFKADGDVENLVVSTPLIDGPVDVSRGGFIATPESFSFTNVESRILDASFSGSGSMDGYLTGLEKADIEIQGEMGPEALQKVSDFIKLPPQLGIRSPLSVSGSHLIWDKNGRTDFAGDLKVKNGPAVSLDVNMDDGKLMVKDLHIRDKTSDAKMAVTTDNRTMGLDFKGNLNKSTLDALLQQNRFLSGEITGDFRVRILADQPERSWIWGKFHGTGLEYPWQPEGPFKVESVSLSSTDNRLFVESILFTLGENRLALGGTVNMGEAGPRFDLNLSADGIMWEDILELSKRDVKETKDKKRDNSWLRSIRGDLNIKTDYLTYDRFTWRPLQAALTFDGNGLDVDVTEAVICGVSTPGSLRIAPEQIQLDFKQIARKEQVEAVVPCMGRGDSIVSGRFDYDGEVRAKGEKEKLAQIIEGNFQLSAYDGRIYKDIFFERLFAFLNVANILRGNFSEFSQKGFAYQSIRVGGTLENGKILFDELVMEAPSMNIAGQGELDVTTNRLNLKLLVNPLQKINRAIGKIPVIRHLTGDEFISFPLSVTGDRTNPEVSTISASEIGSELTESMQNLVEEK